MIRAYFRAMMGCVAMSLLLSGGWWVAVGATLGIPPQVGNRESVRPYVAEPTSGVFHNDAACPLIHHGDSLLKLPGLGAAQRYGVPCEHCLTALAERRE